MINNWVRFNESVEKTDITLEHVMKIIYCRSMCNDDVLLNLLEDKLTDILSEPEININIHYLTLTEDKEDRKRIISYAKEILAVAKNSNDIMDDLRECYQICFDFVDWINFEETEAVLLDFEDFEYGYQFILEEKLLIIKLYKKSGTPSAIDFFNQIKLAFKKLPRISKIQSGNCEAYITKFFYPESTFNIFVEKK